MIFKWYCDIWSHSWFYLILKVYPLPCNLNILQKSLRCKIQYVDHPVSTISSSREYIFLCKSNIILQYFMNLLWYFDKCEWTGRLSPTLYFCYLVWIKSICITISIVSTLGNFATPQRRNWSANERLWDVFCSSPTDDETEQEGLCLWQNGQFGKIRFDPCPAL